MNCKELARNIKNGYNKLKKDSMNKVYNIVWNQELETAEISVVNDAEFKAIIIGDIRVRPEARGYMYLFYSDDRKISFPTIKEIERRLKEVAREEPLSEEDTAYYDWEEYGSLKKQRAYFSEIIKRAVEM